jgi:hypothetical protein
MIIRIAPAEPTKLKFDQMVCPACGLIAVADFVDNGVGMQQCGRFGCEACGWVEATPLLEDCQMPLDDEEPLL